MRHLKKFVKFINEAKFTNADFSTVARKWFNNFSRTQKDMILNDLDEAYLAKIEYLAKRFEESEKDPSKPNFAFQAKDFFKRSARYQTLSSLIGGAEMILGEDFDNSDFIKMVEDIIQPLRDFGMLVDVLKFRKSRRIVSISISEIKRSHLALHQPDVWTEEFAQEFINTCATLARFFDLKSVTVMGQIEFEIDSDGTATSTKTPRSLLGGEERPHYKFEEGQVLNVSEVLECIWPVVRIDLPYLTQNAAGDWK